MSDELYEGPCEAGCQRFHGGETQHTPGCGHYPESLTKAYDDQIAAASAEADALRAEVDRLRGERVKPLVWVNAPWHLDCELADEFGLYQIAKDEGTWFLYIGHAETGIAHATLEAAKAAAQADYAERILSALAPTGDA
ncbi:hypothetical protein AN189_17465 [Loktanella sp. 3ANDIMAR09]|uniref:hypothetical protein n=1 Tax=Loktanella sp. 3ANDIMAR09 TaxID=1225657 RepID=UPI0006F71DC8|nr:hypothetical protein [Loktanella sp. 3ANDIMAR09]KQI67014.1 hypothetical protein AN189_17465 [Loktanella sp. 3ANDIMAR09]